MAGIEALPGGAKDLAFPREEFQSRIERVRKRMSAQGLDGLLVYHAPNVIYLSGYESINMYDSECLVLGLEGDPVLLVPERELGGALIYSWIEEPRIFRRTEYPDTTFRQPMQAAHDALVELGVAGGRIGLELRSMGVAARKYETLAGMLPDAELVDATGLVESVKVVKSALEIDTLRRSAAITDLGMQAAIGAVANGTTDNAIATAAYTAMIGAGSEYLSLAPIVTIGPRAGIIHSTHRRVTIQEGEGVNIELGGAYHRYMAPAMRTVTVGAPNPCVERLATACITALNNVIETMRPGATADDVARQGMKGIDLAGDGVIFHGCFGYSLGVTVPPSWTDGAISLFLGGAQVLQPGMVFHVPMGLRILGSCGAMCSETVLITETGSEALTTTDRKLFEVVA
ncbi:MAG: Xaa-Pro peptidase family protein [Thermomicrobiales bacterium]|nr:Xaa-Pro peptidase family protein [Thermomicrobiales bacterium]